MVKIRGKKRNKLKFMLFVVTAIIILAGTLFVNMSKKNIGDAEEWERYMVIGKENVFVVYGEKLALQVPLEIGVSREKSLKDIVNSKNYEEVVRSLNEILPEKVENFKVVHRGKIEIPADKMKKIPEISVDGKRYILTSSLNTLFLDLYYDQNDNELQDIVIDVLNANGRSGYARKAGEKLANAFPIKYNAANFESFEEYSYIQNKNLGKSKLKELVLELDEKYFKIKDEGTLPTLANAVVVLGREQEGLLSINIYSSKNIASTKASQLKRIGYKIVNSKQGDSKVEESFIEYNGEDYYTAFKLAERLEIKNMMENNGLREKINIYIKE